MYRNKIYKPLFMVPAVVLYTVLFMMPVVVNLIYSFTDWNAIKLSGETAKFIGLNNFKKIFSDPELFSVISRTIWFALVTTLFKNLIGFALALSFNKGLKTKNLLRAIFFLPAMLSPLIIGLIFGSIFMKSGFANQFFSFIGLGGLCHDWLTTQSTALGTTMFVDIWRQIGFNMVIYLAGLQLIDISYHQAASVDGASKLQRLKYITIPMMIPSFVINLLLNLSQGLKAFDIIFVLTGGGPAGSTELINTLVFKEFGSKLYGMSSAYGVIVFAITAVFGLAVLRIRTDYT